MKNYYDRIKDFLGQNEIEFLKPLLPKMKSLKRFDLLWYIPIWQGERYLKINEYVALEPFIEGSYEKFNSNGGYENAVHQLMTVFCHWTWYISGHQFMVCDLQGVK
ncbi:hypothetical protein DPMN_127464 [Dreissena polymorpha]|uniref:Alpha-type protein kinase domain-containing protein n=1 Tax=Dreissena polymorpha TaxID=45954 RepID=A0A9D4H227_DREPO|nr:hypothetical protein DPMN_127464 [Dreissena polymorpha]